MNSDLFTFNGWRFEVSGRVFVVDVRDTPAQYWRVSCLVLDPQGSATAVELLFDDNWNYPPTAEDVFRRLRRHTPRTFDPA